jgi:hypothetical protein
MSDDLDQGAHGWHKSSHSATENECVEVGQMPAPDAVAVRDTKKHGAGAVLAFTPEAWGDFIGDLKADDRLTGGHL